MSEKNKELFAVEEAKVDRPVIEIFTESIDVPLPSKGLVYGPMHALHGKPAATLQEMTPTEEHILYDKKRIREGTVIDDLVQACLSEKTVNVNTLLGGDRDALFFILRASSFDPVYTFDVECPKCETKQTVTIDLEKELSLKMLDLKDVQQVQEFTNRFKFTFPKSQLEIEYRYPTVGDNKILSREKKDRHKAGIDTKYDIIYELASVIVSVNGVTDKTEIMKALARVPSRDTIALRKHISKTEPGVDTTYNFLCKNTECEHKEKSSIPLDTSFFFPHLGK